MFPSYTSVQEGEVFMKSSATSKVIGKGTIQFRSYDGCITTLQGIHYVPESRYNLISLGVLNEKVLSFSSEDDLMEFSNEAYVNFQAKQCVYIAKFGSYS